MKHPKRSKQDEINNPHYPHEGTQDPILRAVDDGKSEHANDALEGAFSIWYKTQRK